MISDCPFTLGGNDSSETCVVRHWRDARSPRTPSELCSLTAYSNRDDCSADIRSIGLRCDRLARRPDVAIVGAIGVSDGGALILGAIFLIPVRAVGGFLIGQSDAKVVLLRHQKKGWALKTIVRSRSPWEAVKLSARAN